MGVFRSVGAASLIASLWVLACSEDEPPRKPPRADAGDSAAGSGGSAGRGGSSGSAGTAGTGGTGGTGVTGGSGGTPTDDAGDASIDSPPDAPEDTFDAGLQCAPIPVPDAGDPGDAGDAADSGDATGNFLTEGGLLLRWRDWSANACRNCPAVAVECPALAAAATFDPTSEVLRLELDAGTAELLSGTISFHWDALDDEGGYVSGTGSAPFVIDKNALTADLSNQLPAGLAFIHNIDVELTDACGSVSQFDDLRVERGPIDPDAGPDAGPTWRVRCAFGEN